MKTQIIISIIFIGIMATGCSTTTYVSLEKNNRAKIEDKLILAEKDEVVGAEVTLTLKNWTEINGELLSVRDRTIIICTEYSAKEEELTNLKYPINTFRNDEIKELTIEGSNYIWTGIVIGWVVGTIIGFLIGQASETGTESLVTGVVGSVMGFGLGIATGGIIGYALSTNDVILQEIPPGYDLSLLNPLARYQDEEPEYLRAIK